MTAVTRDKSLWDHGDAAYKRVIEETLRRYNGAVSKTAVALGITRVTLWRKMKAYGIKPVKVRTAAKSPKATT
jgi:transcriptional regulator of acetoin/glycerol metabolism